jgi:hypothetical protein
MKRPAIRVAVLVLLIGLGGCAAPRGSSTGPGAGPDTTTPATPTDPLVLCRQALPDRNLVSGTWTTVGDLRTWGYGGPTQTHPLADVFPALGPAAPAAWCWTREAADTYTAWGVQSPDHAERALTVVGPTKETPAGPPVIP